LELSSEKSVALDITHGFRSQPFFAAAIVGFVQAVADQALPVQILYGAFEARDGEGCAPVWDLTVFAELVHWSQAIGHFLRTGDARDAAERTEHIGYALTREWAQAGKQGTQPAVRSFATALREFGDAFVTVRVGELLLERRKGEKPSRGPARVRALHEALGGSRADLHRHVPPIAEVLDRLEGMLEPLVIGAENLGEPEARRAVAGLARLYWRLGRYAEAAVVLREGWVNLYAVPEANRPGARDWSQTARKEAEDRWFLENKNLAQRIADVRNDIEHAGFRSGPLPGKTIRDRLDRQIGELAEADARATARAGVDQEVRRRATYFVTRHSGARDWAVEQGFEVDEMLDHLDLERVRPGDTVIGSLPVNLAAEVCSRGGRYLHLSIDLPRERRGTELTAEDMRALGARLQEYDIALRRGQSAKDAPPED
jgi:CRISPR-associated protein Csx16